MTVDLSRPLLDLEPCPRCGAHRWEEVGEVVVCTECNFHARPEDLTSE